MPSFGWRLQQQGARQSATAGTTVVPSAPPLSPDGSSCSSTVSASSAKAKLGFTPPSMSLEAMLHAPIDHKPQLSPSVAAHRQETFGSGVLPATHAYTAGWVQRLDSAVGVADATVLICGQLPGIVEVSPSVERGREVDDKNATMLRSRWGQPTDRENVTAAAAAASLHPPVQEEGHRSGEQSSPMTEESTANSAASQSETDAISNQPSHGGGERVLVSEGGPRGTSTAATVSSGVEDALEEPVRGSLGASEWAYSCASPGSRSCGSGLRGEDGGGECWNAGEAHQRSPPWGHSVELQDLTHEELVARVRQVWAVL